MDNTLNINLAGMLFKIEVKAYQILRNYLQTISREVGENETIEDIESRIAEIFNSQKGAGEVITIENVETMISIIGNPADFTRYEDNEPTTTRSRKRLYRNPNDRVIGGVCGGIGAYLNVDPVLLRILFVLSLLFFGTGFFIYLILWMVILPANNEERQREMYGSEYYRVTARKRQSGIENTFNEMGIAIGSALYFFIRVCLIVIGIVFVTTGFVVLLSLLFMFFFKIPEAFFLDISEITIGYLPNFIKFIVTPSLYPWIMVFSAIVVLLPLMALIYWGIKMIFWFKAKDGMLSLSMFVIWIISATVLGLLIFNEGISFAQESVSREQTPIRNSSDTLYIVAKNKITDIEPNDMWYFRIGNYQMLVNNDNKELHINPKLYIRRAGDNPESITIRKSAHASNATTAFTKAQNIDFNYQIAGDTIFIDDYFTIDANNKWSVEEVAVSINLAVGKVIKVDDSIAKLLNINNKFLNINHKNGLYRYLIITDKGLHPCEDVK